MIARRVGPVQAAVTLEEVKENARVLHDDEDVLIQRLIDAAHVRAESETGRVFGSGEWVIEFDATADKVAAPIWPITSVPAGWSVQRSGRDATLVAGDWPADLRVTVTAGEPAPETVRQAIILLACHWFDNRQAAGDGKGEMPYGVTALLALERRMFA